MWKKIDIVELKSVHVCMGLGKYSRPSIRPPPRVTLSYWKLSLLGTSRGITVWEMQIVASYRRVL